MLGIVFPSSIKIVSHWQPPSSRRLYQLFLASSRLSPPDFAKSTLRRYARATQQQTLYEVLGVKNDASPKEIKEGYILRSKERHPDVNPRGKDSHKEFLKVTEAFRVLRSSKLRRDYDRHLETLKERSTTAFSQSSYPQTPSQSEYPKHVVIDPTEIFSSSPRTGNPANYYGIKGVRRLHNRTILLMCFVFMFFGILLHFAAYRVALFLRKVDLRNGSEKNIIKYNAARQRAILSEEFERRTNVFRSNDDSVDSSEEPQVPGTAR